MLALWSALCLRNRQLTYMAISSSFILSLAIGAPIAFALFPCTEDSHCNSVFFFVAMVYAVCNFRFYACAFFDYSFSALVLWSHSSVIAVVFSFLFFYGFSSIMCVSSIRRRLTYTRNATITTRITLICIYAKMFNCNSGIARVLTMTNQLEIGSLFLPFRF